jgi:hypothetical protein
MFPPHNCVPSSPCIPLLTTIRHFGVRLIVFFCPDYYVAGAPVVTITTTPAAVPPANLYTYQPVGTVPYQQQQQHYQPQQHNAGIFHNQPTFVPPAPSYQNPPPFNPAYASAPPQ